MEQSQYNALISFIWNIANDVLVNAFQKGDYKKIILPMLVLRRIDVLLEPTKAEVLRMKEQLDKNNITNQSYLLCNITGYPFYNTSKFTMKTLKSEINPQRLKLNFLEYLNGYSRDVLDIIDKLHLRQTVDNLTETERLGSIIEKFTSDKINLSSKPILDEKGNELYPALSNHSVGTMFEELLRRFNENYSVTEAGEHFTPRDYVKLLADLALMPVADKITDTTYSIYDGACGTGGILTIAQERFQQIAKEQNKDVRIDIYGQELLPDTYATCKADLMISGHINSFHYSYLGEERDYISFDSTISKDGHAGETFDFCISNPPFGTPWKEDLKKRGLQDKKEFNDSRFLINVGKGDEIKKISFLPDIGDCQMLFLANNVSRMINDTKLGTRIVEVHNGSSLFTGNAGGGESNLRRYIIENDLLEAIVAMPENMFYNTGIGTYIWIVTNHKEERRRGKVQLIDATSIKTSLRKNLGNKNCETSESDRATIVKLLTDFAENEQSKIFDNKEFGYWQIIVERPLRLIYEQLDKIELPTLKDKNDEKLLRQIVDIWKKCGNNQSLKDYELFRMLEDQKIKIPTSKITFIRKYLGKQDENADVCYDKPTDKYSQLVPDPKLQDKEQVPLLYPEGINGFMKNEVLPYNPDAFVKNDATVIGYELSFTKYFYKPIELRTIAEITTDIKSIEDRLKGSISDILNIEA